MIFEFALLLLMPLVFIQVSADGREHYNYTQDKLDHGTELALVQVYEREALRGIYGDDVPTADLPAFDLDHAVRVYTIHAQEFFTAVQSHTLGQVRDSHPYAWQIPIHEDENGYQFVSFGYLADGQFTYITSSAPAGLPNKLAYAFHPEEIQRILLENGVSEAADLYVLSIINEALHIVVAEEDGTYWMIPFTTRPEFFGWENGTLMSSAELTASLRIYLNRREAGRGLLAGGIVGTHRRLIAVAGLSVCLLGVSMGKERKRGTIPI